MHEHDEIDPLVRMAVQHYQFEAIHPFTDGNGRTGRIINILFLVEQGLLDSPILYLSRYIIQNKSDYYRLLLYVTHKQAWADWVLFVLTGVEETCLWTTEKIKAIRYSLIAEHCGTDEQVMRELLDGADSMIEAIERVGPEGEKRLCHFEIPDLGEAEEKLAESELLDPEDPDDMFEPFAKGGLFRKGSLLDRVRKKVKGN